MVPPLVLDIDGTLTTSEHRLDPRVFEYLPAWDAPVVFATGKAFPYPVALAHFLGRQELVIAENGGVVYDGHEVTISGDASACWAVIDEFLARGGDLGWGPNDTVNRWRETEVAVSVAADDALLRKVVEESDAEVDVIDTGYAFHVTSATVSKGAALESLAAALDVPLDEFVAIGDSENDVSTFERVGGSYAVANADAAATDAADYTLADGYMDGTVAVLDALVSDSSPTR